MRYEMRNSKQETIADIVSEMIEFAETDSQTIGRDVLRRRIQNFARRFEAAAKREVAELRYKLKIAEDALVKLQDRLVASVYNGTIDPHEALKIAEDAIAAISEEGGAK